MPYKKKNWITHLQIEGRDLGQWAVAEGGRASVDASAYPDWDGDVQLGGKKTREPMTLKKLYREEVHGVFHWLDDLADRGRLIITRTPTDDDGVVWGRPIIFTGILGDVALPDADKGSSDGGEIEIVCNLDTPLASR
jgi:hypothetical protein